MKHTLITGLIVAGTLAAWAITGESAHATATALTAQSCESLASLTQAALPHATITAAQPVAPGAFTPPVVAGAPAVAPAALQAFHELPAFCRVAATLRPTSDSEIKIEVWMPASGWNGKFQAVGNGGWAGSISYPAMSEALQRGYATGSTDTGHVGGDAAFVVGHPEKVIDFAYRGLHEMTVAAKKIVAANYGGAPTESYFKGCSTGGRQALTEAQRFPLDFDGIIGGATAVNADRLHATQVWSAAQAHRDEASLIPVPKYAVLHDAVLKACDGLDGVVDRVLENPRQCKFDPAVLLCKGGDSPSCLTAAQVETAKRVYAGPGVFPGYELGSEAGWNSSLAKPVGIAYDMYRYLVFKDPAWDFNKLKVSDVALFDKAIGPTISGNDTNLKPFFDHGGKLLMYHGWADPGIPAGNSIEYYTNVVKGVGAEKASGSIRLFMVPGMGHCSGGDGPNTFDSVSALEQWVEKGKVPEQIVASHLTNGKVDRTRPLCPYPQVAVYKGTGSTDDAANFSCKAQ